MVGAEILRDVDFLGEGKLVVRHHHERWDGTGYPDGLAGEEIPLAARVFSVADTLDALTTDRPYRPASDWADAREEIRALRGHAVRPDRRRRLRRDPGRAVRAPPGRCAVTRTILIVDDDPMIRKLIATTLEDISGYRLQEAGDGLEAVERAVDRAAGDRLPGHRHAAAERDRDLPAAAQSTPATAGATIVMLTGDSGDVVERGAQDAGADLFLTKPFSPLHLLRLVDRIGAAR